MVNDWLSSQVPGIVGPKSWAQDRGSGIGCPAEGGGDQKQAGTFLEIYRRDQDRGWPKQVNMYNGDGPA